MSEGVQDWVGGSGGIFAWAETAYKTVNPPDSILSLSLSLSSRPTEKAADGCFLAFFLSGIQPSSQHLLLPTVLFEQLQQGNISTAFQAQACLWLCLSSTRHSAVVLHRQAPHSML